MGHQSSSAVKVEKFLRCLEMAINFVTLQSCQLQGYKQHFVKWNQQPYTTHCLDWEYMCTEACSTISIRMLWICKISIFFDNMRSMHMWGGHGEQGPTGGFWWKMGRGQGSDPGGQMDGVGGGRGGVGRNLNFRGVPEKKIGETGRWGGGRKNWAGVGGGTSVEPPHTHTHTHPTPNNNNNKHDIQVGSISGNT